MKKYILLGSAIIIVGFILSIKFSDSGCGVCPGYANYNPTLILFGLPNINPPDPAICRWVGCQALQIPIFIDLLLTGILLIGFGVFKYITSIIKRKKVS